MTQPALLVLAAGMGSRYGGLKQIDPVGPAGETIIDYSIYDAIRAGFGSLIFVIRRDIERAFKETIGRRFEDKVAVDYVFQELDKLPPGFSVPSSRSKPWGTAHAILIGAEAVSTPFAVVNADDFYGRASYQVLVQHLTSPEPDPAMVGFVLENTLSEFGSVSRGVCKTSFDSYLESVVELTRIEPSEKGIRYKDATGQAHPLSGKELVSLNMWGFTPSIFRSLREHFASFLAAHGQDPKAEFFIPSVINELVNQRESKVKVLRTPASWFGITYKEDRPRVVESIRNLVSSGEYPNPLWAHR
jgi:UTP-glucose-1-phosphate uridylyltransferase